VSLVTSAQEELTSDRHAPMVPSHLVLPSSVVLVPQATTAPTWTSLLRSPVPLGSTPPVARITVPLAMKTTHVTCLVSQTSALVSSTQILVTPTVASSLLVSVTTTREPLRLPSP
jgi:hypothetical protein